MPLEADKNCFLCQYAADSDNPLWRVVTRTENTICVLNRYPYNNGHLLVAPVEHKSRLEDLSPEVHLELIGEITRMVGLLEEVIKAEGFNIGLNLGRVAGAGLPGHLHWHIVPRWNGDTNFMPPLAAVKVIPQSLDALWHALTGALAAREGSQ